MREGVWSDAEIHQFIVILLVEAALVHAPPEAKSRIMGQLEAEMTAAGLAFKLLPLSEEGYPDLLSALCDAGHPIDGVDDSRRKAARAKVERLIEAEVRLLPDVQQATAQTDDEFWESLDFEKLCQEARAILKRKRWLEHAIRVLMIQGVSDMSAFEAAGICTNCEFIGEVQKNERGELLCEACSRRCFDCPDSDGSWSDIEEERRRCGCTCGQSSYGSRWSDSGCSDGQGEQPYSPAWRAEFSSSDGGCSNDEGERQHPSPAKRAKVLVPDTPPDDEGEGEGEGEGESEGKGEGEGEGEGEGKGEGEDEREGEGEVD